MRSACPKMHPDPAASFVLEDAAALSTLQRAACVDAAAALLATDPAQNLQESSKARKFL